MGCRAALLTHERDQLLAVTADVMAVRCDC